MPRPRLLTRDFVLCFAGNFLQALCFNLFLHLPGFLRDLGARDVEVGLLASLTSVAAIAARPPVGRVMDRRGRRRVILAGGAMNLAVCLLYLTVHDLGPWLATVRILHGLAEAMLFSAFFTVAADLVPAERRTEGLALFGISGILPISLGGLLGDAILARAPFATLFGVAAALAAASFAVSLPLRDSRPAAAHGDEPSRGFSGAALQRDLLPLWFVGTVFSTALAAVFTFVKTFVLDTGIGSVGLFFSFYSTAGVVLRLFLGWLPERIGPKRALWPALGLLALGLAGLSLAHSATTVAVSGLLCGFGHGFTFPILSGLVVQRARPAERGVALSLFTSLFDLGMLVGGPAFGLLLEHAGYGAMYGAAAGVVVLGTLAFAFWDARILAASRLRRAGAVGGPGPGVYDGRRIDSPIDGGPMSDGHSFYVDRTGILLFASALGETNPIYWDEEAAKQTRLGGVIAPPTFAISSAHWNPDFALKGVRRIPASKPRPAAPSGAGGGGGGGGMNVARVLHGEQRFEYHKPLRPGMKLSVTTKPGKTWSKEGKKGGTMSFSESVSEYRDEKGELVVVATGVGIVTEKAVGS